jgi:hypothetical protein
MFKLIDVTIGLRVRPEVEAQGLDMDEMGVPGYVGVVDNLALPELSGYSAVGKIPTGVSGQRHSRIRFRGEILCGFQLT